MAVAATYILVGVINIQMLVPILRPLRPGIPTVLAAAVLLLISPGRARRFSVWADFTAKCVLALLVWTILTIPTALHRGLAVEMINHFSRTVLLFCVMVACLRGLRDLERIMWVYFAGIALYSAYALAFARVSSASGRVEVIAGNYDPNDFATFAVTGAPMALFFLASFQPVWKRLLAAAGLAAIAVGVVLSGSRGGFLAMLAAGSFVLFKYSAIRLRYRVASVVIAAVAAGAIASDQYWARIGTILSVEEDYNVTAEVGRTQIWKRGLGYLMERPLTGVGAGNFPYAEGTISPLARQSGSVGRFLAPHNSFVQVMAELGLPGIILFLTIIGSAYRRLRRAERTMAGVSPRAGPLGQAIAASMVGLLVGIFFLSHAYTGMAYGVLALAVGYAKVGRLSAHARARIPTRSNA